MAYDQELADAEREILKLKAENEKLLGWQRRAKYRMKETIVALNSLPIDCLGEDCTQEGEAYPIRDEVVYYLGTLIAEAEEQPE